MLRHSRGMRTRPSTAPPAFLEAKMAKNEKVEPEQESTLENMVGPTKFTILPGLVLEDKMTIKTQRKLERQFEVPIANIFPGEIREKGKTTEKWGGVNFKFIDNLIPLLTIMAQQVDELVTEESIEHLMEDPETEKIMDVKLEEFFAMVAKAGQSKNSQKPKRTKTITTQTVQ